MGTLKSWIIYLVLTLIGGPFVGRSDGAVLLTSRLSQLNIDHAFGYAGNVTSQSSSVIRTDLTQDFDIRLTASAGGEGSLGDGSWIANYQFDMNQTLTINSDGTFGASASNLLFAFAGDAGIVSLTASPGNLLEMEFSLTEDERFRMVGDVVGNSHIAIERSITGAQWESVFSAIAGFDSQLQLAAGRYRLTASGSSMADGSQTTGESWVFDFRIVPEPTGYTMIGVACLIGTGARRKPK